MTILHAALANNRITSPLATDLILSIGTFCVTDLGILARLRPPLSRLPGYYPWQYFPTGVATLKLLVADQFALTDSVVNLIMSGLGVSEEEKDQLAHMIGNVSWIDTNESPVLEHESEFCDDIDRLIRWGVGLADRCPNRSVARDLVQLPKMGPRELDGYVRTHLS
jgi:hypothetical protein